MPGSCGATFENVTGSAIWAKCLAGFFYRQKHPRMCIPHHLIIGRAVQRQLSCRYFYRSFPPVPVAFRQSGRILSGDGQTAVNHERWFSERPLTTSKNIDCNFSVTGPRLPEPITRLSSSRIGVVSAAVPVKKASSAI